MCERLTFASIYQSNLDEFYMVRVGSLVDQMFLSKDIRENKTNMTPKEQLEAVLSRTRKLNRKRDVIYEEIMDSLKEYGVQMLNFHKIEKEDRNYLERYFEAEVAPVISPSIVGKRQPFPFLRIFTSPALWDVSWSTPVFIFSKRRKERRYILHLLIL